MGKSPFIVLNITKGAEEKKRGDERLRDKKQWFHLEPPRGLLNDPNGLAFFRGKYYVFFQWNRFAKDHSYKEWGMFTSTDMLNWTFEGSALLPDQTYDKCGTYSGSGLMIDHKLCLFYTGNVKKDGRRKSSQCMAVTDDGHTFLKLGKVIETPEEYTEHFRDPKVFRTRENGYYMVIGGQRKNGKGAVALFHSGDGFKWEYSGMPAVTESYEMIECPDLFQLSGEYVLLYNPQSRDNEKDKDIFSFSAAKFIKFDEQKGFFNDNDLDRNFFRIDYGFDFYAPQTFEDANGRRILYAWMSRMDSAQESAFAGGEPRIHCLTLPRELRIREGKLLQMPVRELEQLKGEAVRAVRTDSGAYELNPPERAYSLRFSADDPKRKIAVRFHGGEASLTWFPKEQMVRFCRKNWLTGLEEQRECTLETFTEAEIWSDQSSLEIFLNGGEAVMSSRIFPAGDKMEVIISGIGGSGEIRMNRIKEEYRRNWE